MQPQSTPLIAIDRTRLNDKTVQTVNARDLHTFLEVGKDFSTWLKERIRQYDFIDEADYTTFEATPQNGGAGNRGVKKEYALSLDMAKELSMVERTAKGKQARRYFIAMEEKAKATPQIDLENPAQLRGLLSGYTDKVIELAAQLDVCAPKAESFDRLAGAEGSLCITDAAKALQMRRNRLRDWLMYNGWIYRRAGNDHLLGYQTKTAQGLLEHKVTTVSRGDGSEKIAEQVRITAKGMAKLVLIFTASQSEVAQ